MKKLLRLTFAGLMGIMLMSSCSTFNDDSDPYGAQEAAKNLSGVWKLKTVTRNNIDITKQMDFSKFTLHLNEDGTYKIDNYLPFVVREEGQWATDDLFYPFILSFKENIANAPIEVELNYPIVDGERALSITHSPGCYSNSYTYTLYRVSNDKK